MEAGFISVFTQAAILEALLDHLISQVELLPCNIDHRVQTLPLLSWLGAETADTGVFCDLPQIFYANEKIVTSNMSQQLPSSFFLINHSESYCDPKLRMSGKESILH
jgi:hypothetical protein